MPITTMHDIREEVRDELIAELIEAFSSHVYRCEILGDDDRCLICANGHDHHTHIKMSDAARGTVIAEYFGDDFPYDVIVRGHTHCLVINPRKVAVWLGKRAGRISADGCSFIDAPVVIAEAAE